MARDLRARLAGIRSATSNRDISEAPRRNLYGWNLISPHFWMRELIQKIPPVNLELPLDASPYSPRLKDTEFSLSGLRFFDLETTGLSGGTGTVAFLGTLGRFTASDQFCTVQYFMDDYPGEPAMVSRLAVDLLEASSIVTYNGASFDLPLFRTRCIMNGLKPPEYPRHMDLLPVARRLWRTLLPDCSLGTIERSILCIDRGPDLPGCAIPERWFNFLRGGLDAEEAMDVVFSHNDSDVRTLALLLLLMAKGFKEGQIANSDPVGLAFLLGRSNPELALSTLESALAKGELRAIKPLMRRYWKAGRRSDRMGLVPFLPEDSYGLYMKSLHAEKVDKNLDVALILSKQALVLADGSLTTRIERRVMRLDYLLQCRKD